MKDSGIFIDNLENFCLPQKSTYTSTPVMLRNIANKEKAGVDQSVVLKGSKAANWTNADNWAIVRIIIRKKQIIAKNAGKGRARKEHFAKFVTEKDWGGVMGLNMW